MIWLPRVWFAAVGLFLLWQTMTYRGISAFAAEWQYNAFGTYHPALTYLFLLLMFCSPLLILRVLARRHARSAVPPTPEARLSRSIGTASRLLRTLVGAALGVAIASAAVALLILFLPSANGPVSPAVATVGASPPPTGPVELSGRVLYNKTAVFNEDFLVARRSNRFAPMVAAGSDETVLHYFVELPPESQQPDTAAVTVRKGVLRKGGLPGDLVRLYRYAGFRVDPNYYVLFASGASMRQPYLSNALQLMVLALFIGLVAGIFAYRRRRLRKLTTSGIDD